MSPFEDSHNDFVKYTDQQGNLLAAVIRDGTVQAQQIEFGDGTKQTTAASGGGAVSSVFTRTGAVVATTGDYTVAQVTGAQATANSLPNNPAMISTKVANYQPALTDGTILCNGTFTITLLATFASGTTFRIKNIGAGTITLSSSVNIDFATTFILNPYPGASVDVQFDGSQWWIL